MEKTLKIFISCVLGAGIGSIIALQLIGYLWWIGMLIGGLVGYLSYEFKTVIAAAKQAWKEATGWRLETGWWKVVGYGFLTFFVTAITVGIACIPMYIWTPDDVFKNLPKYLQIPVVFLIITGGVALGVWVCTGFFGLWIALQRRFEDFDYETDMRLVKEVMADCNPFNVYFRLIPVWIIYTLMELVAITIRGIPDVLAVSWKFIKTVFRLIHSDIRLLCGVDAAIGTAIGYFSGNVIVGMLAGGVLGVVNYKIVSIKILRLNLKTQ